MRALLLGDIHTEAVLLRKAIGHAMAAGVDEILSVGDIVDGPGDPVSCITQLRAHSARVVRGNHERWVVEGHPMDPFDYPAEVRGWLAGLPATLELDSPTGRILLGHGIGADDMLEIDTYTKDTALAALAPLQEIVQSRCYRWLIGGHTHRPMVRTIAGLTIINPGTLVLEQDPGFVIADFARGELEHWQLVPSIRRHATWHASALEDADWASKRPPAVNSP
jgi:predicted phosphodiesterase